MSTVVGPPDQLGLFISVVDHVLARLRAGDCGPRTSGTPAGSGTTLDIVPDETCTP
jgi:hypothetical protein